MIFSRTMVCAAIQKSIKSVAPAERPPSLGSGIRRRSLYREKESFTKLRNRIIRMAAFQNQSFTKRKRCVCLLTINPGSSIAPKKPAISYLYPEAAKVLSKPSAREFGYIDGQSRRKIRRRKNRLQIQGRTNAKDNKKPQKLY